MTLLMYGSLRFVALLRFRSVGSLLCWQCCGSLLWFYPAVMWLVIVSWCLCDVLRVGFFLLFLDCLFLFFSLLFSDFFGCLSVLFVLFVIFSGPPSLHEKRRPRGAAPKSKRLISIFFRLFVVCSDTVVEDGSLERSCLDEGS